MAGADASRGRLVFRPEITWNDVPPANAATTRIRFTGESLHHRNATVVSDEIRPDRQRDDLILVGCDVDGTIDAELSYGNFDWLFEAVLCSTWATDALQNGTTNKSFTFEKGFMDITKFISYRGCVINTLDLNVTSRRVVTLSAGIMGSKGYPLATSICGTTTPTEPNGNEVIAAGPDIKLFDTGGSNVELNDVETREVRLAINNNVRLRDQATQIETDNFGKGVMEITGSLNGYFSDIVHLNEFLANGLFGLGFSLSDPTNTGGTMNYKVTLPRLKVTDMNPAITGGDADVMAAIPFRALVDAAVGYTIKIERNVALT